MDAALADTAGSEGDVSAPGDLDGSSDAVDEDPETSDQFDDVADHHEAEGTRDGPWEESNATEPGAGTDPDDAGGYDY